MQGFTLAMNSRDLGDGFVDLGFAEEQESYLLTNRYFPSKIGGKPAWLGKLIYHNNLISLMINVHFRARKYP